MAASSIPSRSVFSFFAPLFYRWQRWRWSRRSANFCPTCNTETAPNWGELQRSKHHAARVMYARMHLEQRIRELFLRVPQTERSIKIRSFVGMVMAIKRCGIIEANLKCATLNQWRRASSVVHGSKCDASRATSIVNKIDHLLWMLSDERGYRVADEIDEFAQPDLKVITAADVDYEAEQFIEQFGQAVEGGAL